jgi:flagellar assembly factor FliW
MKIETTRFGQIDLEESVFLHFPWGIPGFESSKRYVLIEHREGPFHWLQAVDEPALAFVVVDPEALGVTYRVPAEKLEPVSLEAGEDLAILLMVSFQDQPGGIRPNLRGPIVCNSSARLAYQWVIDAGDLSRFLQRTGERAAEGE